MKPETKPAAKSPTTTATTKTVEKTTQAKKSDCCPGYHGGYHRGMTVRRPSIAGATVAAAGIAATKRRKR